MSRTASFRFLCDCLAWPERPVDLQRLRRAAESKNFRWASFVTVASEYLVASTLPFVLQKFELRDALPQATLDYLDGLAATIRQRNNAVVDQSIEVARVLNRLEVTPVLLKGAANLVRSLYPDPGMRVMTDLDLLVPAASIDECVACLREAGFRPLTDYCHPHGHHDPPLGRPDLPLPLELHHRVLAHPYDEFLTADEVRKSAVSIEGHGVSLAVLSPTCAVIHNVAHTQLCNHDYLYGRIDLRSLVDFALLCRAYADEIDWLEVRRSFTRRGGVTALNFHLLCAHDLLRAPMAWQEQADAGTQLLYRRARYLVGHPRLLDVSIRLTRPWLLLRRELSDPTLRRRLAGNVIDPSWWGRHLKMLAGR